MTLKIMVFDIQSKIMKRNPFLYEKRYIIWIVRIMYYKYKELVLYLNTFCKCGVTSNIGLKSAFWIGVLTSVQIVLY